MVAGGTARFVYHPVAFLDQYSSTHYSSRAAAASGCAADAGVFVPFVRLLYYNQPPENGSGLPEDRLIALGRQAGAGQRFADCVNADTYAPWAAAVTEAASRSGVTATPTVRVNGRLIDNTAEALRNAVRAAR
jgi:protein-disulfide isomerase